MPIWRCLDTGSRPGAFNMAVDEALLKGAGAGPVLRFYGWDPPAISFGNAQEPQREVDVDKCRAAGLDLVRRPTGGRAVLHWHELTYSVVCTEDDAALGGRVEDTYCRIGHCLVEGLRCLGVEAELERARSRPAAPRGPGTTAPCFSSTARWEVKYRGRKLIGSAQRRASGAILQHGSLPLGDQHAKLTDFLPAAAQHLRSSMAQRLEKGSIHLRACVDRNLQWSELVDCMGAGFRRHLGVELEPDELDGEEERHVADLMQTRSAPQGEVEHLVGI